MPAYKTNLDLQRNQLVNPVLHKLHSPPLNPVAGLVYYNMDQGLSYFYNGSSWIPMGGVNAVRQFAATILNPTLKSGAIIARLYENLVVVRIDAHFSTVNTVTFNVDGRSNVNQAGTNLTDKPMNATNNANEYSAIDHPSLRKDDWLYLSIPSINGEVLGVLTVNLTCTAY